MRFHKLNPFSDVIADKALCGHCDAEIQEGSPEHHHLKIILRGFEPFIEGKGYDGPISVVDGVAMRPGPRCYVHDFGACGRDCLLGWFGTPGGEFAPVHHVDSLPPPSPCRDCGSWGKIDCPACVIALDAAPAPAIESSREKDLDGCRVCKGDGAVPCARCDGAGEVQLSEFWCSHSPEHQTAQYPRSDSDLYAWFILKVPGAIPVVVGAGPWACPHEFNDWWQTDGVDELDHLFAELEGAREQHTAIAVATGRAPMFHISPVHDHFRTIPGAEVQAPVATSAAQ